MGKKALITCGHLQRHIGTYDLEFQQHGVELWVPPLVGQQFGQDEMVNMIQQVDVVIAGDDCLNEQVLEAAAKSGLQGIVRWGIGTDNVDKVSATRLGILVYNTPGMFNNEVADLALGHLLCLARHIHKMNFDVRAGNWTRYEGVSLSGKVAGVIGLGGIGREISRRARAFGMEVIGFDPVSSARSELKAVGCTQTSLEVVLERADVIFLACALTADNHHMLDESAFGRMKRGVIVINVARGPIIDERALFTALVTGHVSAAGLDVFETEPLPAFSPLRGLDNCLFGTHSGSSTLEAIQRTNRASLDIALAILGINPGYLEHCNRVA